MNTDKLRKKLYELISKGGSLCSGEILKISQELDKEIVRLYNSKIEDIQSNEVII
jgi:hypothetical protein